MNIKSKDQKTTLEEKTKYWDNIRQQIDQVADTVKRGFRADPELRELITGLSMLGTQPRISAFGEVRDNSKHATKRRVIAPRVWIEPEVDKKLKEKYKELGQNYSRAFKKDEKKSIGEPDEDFIKARDELDEFDNDLTLPHNVLTGRLFDLLTEFYQDRQAPYGAQIRVSGFFKRVMLDNSGDRSLYLFTDAEQERKLKEYQDEFIAFGKFLKTKYLSE